MATPKGNFVAYQPLRPTEYKVGDLYLNLVDGMIKRGDAQRAAAAKAKQDQLKMIGERFEKLDIKPYTTDSTLTDMATRMFKDTADYIGEMRMRAETDPNNSFRYLSLADKAKNDYLSLSTTLGSEDFLKKLDEKRNSISSGEVFDDSDELDKFNLISKGMLNAVFDKEEGVWKFAVPKNNNATDNDTPDFLTTGQLIGVFTNPLESDLLNDTKANGNNGFYNQIRDDAKTLADEWLKNTDGNITRSWSGFADERGKNLFDTTFGSYNANNIDPRLNQYSKVVLGKQIEDESDYNNVKNSVIERLKSYVPNTTEIKTEQTKVQQAIDSERLKGIKLDNRQKEYDLANPRSNTGDSSGNGMLGNGTLSLGNVVLNIKNPTNKALNHYQTRGVSYFVNGNTNEGKDSKIGVTTYWNPNALGPRKGGFSFAMNIPSKDGKEVVIEGVTAERAKQILSSNKVRNVENVIALMKTVAEQNGLSGVNPTGIGRNFNKYKVDFSTVDKKTTESDNSMPFTSGRTYNNRK